MKASIRFEVQVPIKVFRDGGVYVSHCPVFDVSSQGETPDDAKINIIEALTGFLITCYEMGTLDEVLKECGFIPGVAPQRYEPCGKDEDIIDIPLPFMLAHNQTPG